MPSLQFSQSASCPFLKKHFNLMICFNCQIVPELLLCCLWFPWGSCCLVPQKFVTLITVHTSQCCDAFKMFENYTPVDSVPFQLSKANVLCCLLKFSIAHVFQSLKTCDPNDFSTLKLFYSRCCTVFGFCWGPYFLVLQKFGNLMILQL